MLPSTFSDLNKKARSEELPIGPGFLNNEDFTNTTPMEYNQTPDDRTVTMYPLWEAITINDEKNIVIGTNKCTGREWFSVLWGFENIEGVAVMREVNSVFRLRVSQLLTKIEYLTNNLLMVTFHNGAVELWSTYSQNRSRSRSYSLLKSGGAFEHKGPVNCLEKMETHTNKAITGGEDGTLIVWDWSNYELHSSNTYRYAHMDTITGISHLKTNNSMFATCSRDKSVLLWDLRTIKAAQALFSNHFCAFESIAWLYSEMDRSSNILYVGDSAGFLNSIDKRKPDIFLKRDKIFNHPVRKILCNGNRLGIIANTNTVKIFSGTVEKIIYENGDGHTHFVRDCVWYDEGNLLTVGCDSKLVKHNIYESIF